MKVRKLYKSSSTPYQMTIKTMDGKYMRFGITPFRKIQEADLTPCLYYMARGNNAKEAEWYFYKLYGLEKAEPESQERPASGVESCRASYVS